MRTIILLSIAILFTLLFYTFHFVSALDVAQGKCPGKLEQSGLYILKGDIAYDEVNYNDKLQNCLEISVPSTTIDCQNYSITITGSKEIAANGVYSNQRNSIIRNCKIFVDYNDAGIYSINADKSEFKNNLITSDRLGSKGINVANSTGVKIQGNVLSSLRLGIGGEGLYSASINSNNLFSNENGLSIEGSTNNISFNSFRQNIHGLIASKGRGNKISDNFIIANIEAGAILSEAENNSVTNNTILDNAIGIHLQNSSNNIVSYNVLSNSKLFGIRMENNSNSNIIWNNSIQSETNKIAADLSSMNNFLDGNNLAGGDSDIPLSGNNSNMIEGASKKTGNYFIWFIAIGALAISAIIIWIFKRRKRENI